MESQDTPTSHVRVAEGCDLKFADSTCDPKSKLWVTSESKRKNAAGNIAGSKPWPTRGPNRVAFQETPKPNHWTLGLKWTQRAWSLKEAQVQDPKKASIIHDTSIAVDWAKLPIRMRLCLRSSTRGVHPFMDVSVAPPPTVASQVGAGGREGGTSASGCA